MSQLHEPLPLEHTFHQGLAPACLPDVLDADSYFRRELGFSSLPGPKDLRQYDYSNRSLGILRSDSRMIGGIYAITSPATSLSEARLDIQYLAVDAGLRRCGMKIGSYLLTTVEEAAKNNGITKARLISLHAARQFWLSQGYSAVDGDAYTLEKLLVDAS